MNWSIERKLTVRFTMVLLLLGIGGAIVSREVKKQFEADSSVKLRLRTLERLEEAAKLTVDLESGTRGYVITGQEEYLERYLNARANVGDVLKGIGELTAGYSRQQARVSSLARMIVEHLEYHTALERAVRERGVGEGRRLIASGRGRMEMDAIRGMIEEMRAEEHRLLARQLEESGVAGRRKAWSLAGLGGMIGALLIVAFIQLRRHLAERRRAERLLQASEERYRQVTEAAPFALIVQCQGRFAYANPAALKMFGASEAGELLGKPILEFVHPSRHEVLAERMRRVTVERASAPPMEFKWFRLDGSEFWAEATVNPTTHEGQAGGVAILRDVSQLKAAEMLADEREAQLRMISDNLPGGAVFQAVQDGGALRFTYISSGISLLTGLSAEEILARPGLLNGLDFEEDAAGMNAAVERAVEEGIPLDREIRIRTASGTVRWLHYRAAARRRTDGDIQLDGVLLDITDRRRAEEELRRIEWLLNTGARPPSQTRQAADQSYGDLTVLNRSRLILDAVGADVLREIVDDHLDLLDTSAAVYEKNGDYALGILASSWCQFMDLASRNLCGAAGNEEALACGKWLCHESCWGKASKVSIETGQPADIECEGGIHLYAVPIHAGEEIVGSIKVGYGDPPRDPDKQRELAAKYGVSVEELHRHAEAYETRPPYIIELAKQRLQSSARLIGEIVERKRIEEELRRLNEELEQRVAERTEKLRGAELRYRTLFEESPDGLLVIDPETALPIEFNESARLHLGYSREEFARLRVGDYEVVERPEETRARFEKILRQGRDDFETQHRTKAGEIRDVSLSVRRIELAGKPAFHCVCRDITERTRAEQMLRESDERFRLLVDHVTEYALIGLDAEGRVVSWNEGAERINGYTAEQIIGRHMALFYTPEDVASGKPASLLRLAREQGTAKDEGWRVRHDGSRFWAEVALTAQRDERHQLRGFSKVTCDRTERKRAEDRLRAESARLTEAQKIARLGDWEYDLRTDLLRWSSQVYEIFGVSPETHQPRQDDFVSHIHPEDLARYEEAGRTLFRTGAPVDVDFRILLPEGRVRWLTSRAFLETNESGKPVRLYGTVQDVTERLLAQQALQASQENYRRIVETAAEGIWVIGPENRTTYANRQMAAMLGWSVEEMMGKSLLDFMDEEGRLEAERRLRLRREGVAEQHDFRFRAKDGKDRWTIVSTAPLFGADGKYAGAMAMVTDITERKHLEDQFRQAQKLESIGRLAGGVAHDFNNLLTVINGHSELLLKKLTALDPMYDSVSEILHAGQNAAALTQQLLAYSRKQIVEPKVSDLNRIVEDTRTLLDRVLGEDIELQTMLQPELWHVRVDRTQFMQVLMNLAVNARDAMPDGGHLLIETANLELDARYASQHPEVKPGSYVQLSVSDSGVGMDEDTRANVFEPFFTTKKAGTGTGLGLATVHGVVRQAGGWIWVYSEPGGGTTFKIYLPRVEGPCEEQEAASPIGKLRGSETVLLVEDQKELRSLVEVVLEGQGYKVLAAANADEALLSAERYAGPIHLLLTDVVMPGMTGRTLAERLKPSRPEMRVLYISGYTQNVIVHRGMLDAGVDYLAKPFGPDTLAKKVRQVLGPERAAGTILVVDDESGVRNLLRQVLRGAGYEVLEASDGGQALERLAESRVHLVITDLMMPEQEGLETIQEVRRRHPKMKIIAMSGAFGGDYLNTAKLLGADAAHAKPIRPDDFLETVRRLLSEE